MLPITLLISLFLFSGCVNKRGISERYYNSCHEYYDLQGYYHKDCDDNLINFSSKESKSETIGQEIR
ncbi:MAG: hypothetical protein U9N52_00270 [Campylobacterota bacterium]|nr:hypothetical protein [Campylobacterota bacterium]